MASTITDRENFSPVAVVDQFLNTHTTVEYVRLHWVDLSGVMRTRIIPKERALKIVKGEDHCGLAENCMIVPVLPAPQWFAKGIEAWELHPQWSSLRLCGYRTNHAMVMCALEHKGAADPFERCPRHLLDRILGQYPQTTNFLMGFEIEFVVLDKDLAVSKPLDYIVGYSMMAGLRRGTMNIIEEIIRALRSSDISIHHIHTETTHQIEIALAAKAPMEAIDDLMYSQEIIRSVCPAHDLKATLTPRPVLHPYPQNGIHLHLSSNKEVMRSIITGAL